MTGCRSDSPWLRWYRPPSDGEIRLLCMPPAGSAASFYRTWVMRMPKDVAFGVVQYPGRENRLAEPPLQDLEALADGAAKAIGLAGPGPVALLGHSLGAAVAYEVALRLSRPAVLFVSGCAAPSVHLARSKRVWDDPDILEDLRRMGGPNRAALDHHGLLALVLPALRADYNLTERYTPRQDVTLDCPIVALHGDQDQEVRLEEMEPWRAVTTGSFERRLFHGDHFFPIQCRDQVIGAIEEALCRLGLLGGDAAVVEPSDG